ncbi:MAG: hypothetical protein A2Y12_12880 [Planctomycetes bacterium GWF2_42_9]|nr:MAG: hypothetical protein A2Y12_12880 [Planctomycetes bacterium GWF2_42_9]
MLDNYSNSFIEYLSEIKTLLLKKMNLLKMTNHKIIRWGCLFVIIMFLCILICVISERNPYRKQLMVQVAQITDSNIANWKDQLRNSPNLSWMFKEDTSIYEKGILLLQDGTIVKFSFISHHVSKDHESHSYFNAPHFSKHVKGGFCCEVDIGKQQPKDIKELNLILSQYDGVSP